MIVLIFWSVHKNLMLDRFFSDQMAPPLDLLILPRHAEYLGKWGFTIYFILYSVTYHKAKKK